jgi:hypothetical protein
MATTYSPNAKPQYLQGQGTANDAIFTPIPGTTKVRVTAEIGMTGCYAKDIVEMDVARELYLKLLRAGWNAVPACRRTEQQIADAING